MYPEQSIASPKLAVVGGGTGGHLFPGVAVAEAWLALHPTGRVVFVGSERGIEAKVVPALGYELVTVPTERLKNAGLLERARSLLRMPRAMLRARAVVAALAPDVVLGVGGFVSGPVVLAAALSGVPCAVAEQNALPGLTNRLLSRVVRRIYTAFPEAEKRLPQSKVKPLGNPVRAAIRRAAAAAPMPAGGRRVLVMGGSQGARTLNERLPSVFAAVSRRFPDLTVRHQAGRGNGDAVAKRYADAGLAAARVDEFIDDVAAAVLDADLVVCRSGATTVAELACIGRPALFIPFPFAADDHQAVNAASLVGIGAARMVREADCTPERLEAELVGLLETTDTLAEMGRLARTRGRPEAADTIARDLASLLERSAA
ncbi:undecaprenyldiphospho-muramoylpentapeptide beta-N-acetylglucosaminyltransferase [Myxococcota bacterium]|jgi:UDP-N-acetylglucosamine--N-acetylmuramyl-(pentapeptide) pyrophosphoryl-undecaprenol N-acetylglucosamine transferase|nr:undecaprenyldiphospho-muramoylpentapeptide beta-N-acetylglucosaminyltransferase [Myxococcota bacterium]